MLQLTKANYRDRKAVHNATVEVEWRGPHGYLSALDYPLLPFYGIMCVVYGIFALAWFVMSVMYSKNLLTVHFWIGKVLFTRSLLVFD